jgi:hypothetical protein
MTAELPRALSRPSGLPLYAWVTPDNTVRGLQTFEDPGQHPGNEPQADGSRCLPVFGEESPADLDRQYFSDEFKIDGDFVLRTRTVQERGV